MRTVQLFVLGMLAREGPMHGHQIRRQAELERAEFWGKVKVSSLYAALHRMEAEGLIAAVERTQEGRFPARTVYAITAEAGASWWCCARRASATRSSSRTRSISPFRSPRTWMLSTC